MQDCAVSVCHRAMLVLVPLLASSYLHSYTCLSQLHTSATALHKLLCADLFKSLAWSAHANPEQISSLHSSKIFWSCSTTSCLFCHSLEVPLGPPSPRHPPDHDQHSCRGSILLESHWYLSQLTMIGVPSVRCSYIREASQG